MGVDKKKLMVRMREITVHVSAEHRTRKTTKQKKHQENMFADLTLITGYSFNI